MNVLLRAATLVRTLREYRRNERLPRDAFEAGKLTRFRRLLEHARRHSPYYARLIRERGIVVESAVPADFPPMTKDDLREHFDEIVTDRRLTTAALEAFCRDSSDPNDLYLGQFHVLRTSGSSGHPLSLVLSDRDWVRGMSQALRPAAKPRMPRLWRPLRTAYFGAIGGHFGGEAIASSSRRGLLGKLVRCVLFDVNDPLSHVVPRLSQFRPDVLMGYVSGLKQLAEAQLAGSLAIAPQAVYGGGETMTKADRTLLERAFGCLVRSNYGCSEHLLMGLSDPRTDAMVLYDDHLIFELHEDHCLVTNLFNETMPLVRYRLDDVLRPTSGPGPAPPYLAIETLIGRAERAPVLRNDAGREETLLVFGVLTLSAPDVNGYQLRIVDSTRVRLLVRVDAGTAAVERAAAVAALRNEMRALLDRKGMRGVACEAVEVDAIPVDPRTRKVRAIVDERDLSPGPQPPA